MLNGMSRPPTLIRDPRAVPVASADSHLPALSGERLQPARLKARFASPPDWRPEFRGDGGGPLSERAPAAAAVLVALVVRRVSSTRSPSSRTTSATTPGRSVSPGDGWIPARWIRS